MSNNEESDKEESENQGFKVQDRRRFAPDGTPIDDHSKEKAAPSTSSEAEVPKPPSSEPDLPVEFASLLLSLAAGAQAALGIAPHPVTGKLEKNLKQAKYSVDLLGLLEEKTKGNLSKEEAQLLEALLYDLRMRYIEAKKS